MKRLTYFLLFLFCTCKLDAQLRLPINVQGVFLGDHEITLVKNATYTLNATVIPHDADNKKVTWSSSDTSVATVDRNSGKVTAVGSGQAKITVTTEDGGKKDECTVKVSADDRSVANPLIVPVPERVTGVRLDKPSMTLTEGTSEKLTANVSPSTATNKKVIWRSSNTTVANVSSTGVVTAVKPGTAMITVETEDGSKTATCSVTVKAATISVTGVSLNKSTLNLQVGESEQLDATVSPDNATDRNVKWSSINENVAIVNSYGKVVAKNPGATRIFVKTVDESKEASCAVSVKPVPVESISLNKTILVLEKGSSEKLSAIVSPYNATDKSVKWSSTNKYVANVTQAGDVVALKKGVATIWAMTEDGSKQTNCTVVVNGAKKKKTAGFFIGVDSGVNILTRFEKVDLSYGVMAGYAGAVGVYARGSSNFGPTYTVDEESSSIRQEVSVLRRSITGGMMIRLINSSSWSWYLNAGAGVCERDLKYYQDGRDFDNWFESGFLGYEVGTIVKYKHFGLTGGYVTSGRKVGNVYEDVHLGLCLFF